MKLFNKFKALSVDNELGKEIMVLGSGCQKCHELKERCDRAVIKLNLKVEVGYSDDSMDAVKYGIMSLPALIIKQQVVSSGQMLSEESIMELLRKTYQK